VNLPNLHLGLPVFHPWPPFWALALPLVLGFVAMPWLIGLLARFGMGQRIRAEGPQSHMAKGGTPTSGGLAVMILIFLTVLAVDRSVAILPCLGALVLGGTLGLVDDITTVRTASRGLLARQKIVIQLGIGLGLGLWFTELHQDAQLTPFGTWHMGGLLIPVAALALVAASNAFNLTDGSDGLAPGVIFLAALAVAFAARRLDHHQDVAQVRLMLATAGATGAFLVYNLPPARAFLGGVGSEGLGMLIAATCISTGLLWLLPLIAVVPVLETASVMIQVYVFKSQHGRRFFKMSPLHHHFELTGWSEWRIATSAWGITALAGLFTMFLTRRAA
jgi:phospho-N-acetylmuramoyl-pentapeptide-transferase